MCRLYIAVPCLSGIWMLRSSSQKSKYQYKDHLAGTHGLLTNVLLNIQDEEKLRWSFRLYDMDNNGVIDIEEMVVIIETLDSIEGVKPGDTNVEKK